MLSPFGRSLRRSTSLLLFFCVAFSVAAAGGCSASGSGGGGFFTQPDGNEPVLGTPVGDGGTAARDGATGPAPCKPNPSCARELCECKDKSVMATDGVCLPDGSCDTVARCNAACGAAGFSGGAWEEKACSDEGESCGTYSAPTISCACTYGYGVDTYPRCTNGYCSSALHNVCPKSCASQGGWTCRGAGDCTPVVCACKDGTYPATAGACSSGTCAGSSAVCPSACSDHGGWSGTSPGPTTDGGTTTGPKAPGATCSAGSECTPFDCTCLLGNTFKAMKSCQSGRCATKADTCNVACMGNGGWNGL